MPLAKRRSGAVAPVPVNAPPSNSQMNASPEPLCSPNARIAPDRRFANGMFAVYVDPRVVDTSNFFDGEISRYGDFIRATKPVAGVDAVLIPGDPERKMRADRTKNGVPLPDDTWAAIVNTAREVGVSEVSIQRATA